MNNTFGRCSAFAKEGCTVEDSATAEGCAKEGCAKEDGSSASTTESATDTISMAHVKETTIRRTKSLTGTPIFVNC